MGDVLRWIGIVLLVVLVAGGFVLIAGWWMYNRKIDQEVSALYARQAPREGEIVTEEMLRDLPAPIQRHLRYAGVVGKPRVHSVRLKQAGRFRQGPDQPWMEYRADQYYTVDDPGFIWDATFTVAGLPFMRVRDRYVDGKGNIRVTLAALVGVAEEQGEKIDQGTMLRYLNEIMWFPSAYLSENVTFTPIDDGSAQVTFSDHGQTVSATLYIDAEGKMTNFVAERYYGGDGTLQTWTTPMSEYGEYAGRRLPRRGQGVWLLPAGEFAYVDPAIVALEHDRAEPY